MEFTDRYMALGIPYPDPQAMCKGHCEGIGFYPERDASILAWIKAHKKNCSITGRIVSFYRAITKFDHIYLKMAWQRCDGYHFVKCEDCFGTGLRP